MHARSTARIVGIALAVFAFGTVAQQSETQQQERERQQSKEQGAAGQAQAKGDKAPVLVLMPVAVYPRGEQIANGCWVRLYEGENFEGRQLTVIGPAELPDVEENVPIFGFESAEVGPKARVVTYDGENYQDRTATLETGRQYANLEDDKLGLFEDIESLQVSC